MLGSIGGDLHSCMSPAIEPHPTMATTLPRRPLPRSPVLQRPRRRPKLEAGDDRRGDQRTSQVIPQGLQAFDRFRSPVVEEGRQGGPH